MMSGLELAMVIFYGLWVAGFGMIAVTWLAWLSTFWRERRLTSMLFAQVRDLRQPPYRDLTFVRRLADYMEIAGIRAPVEGVIGLMLFMGTLGWFGANAAVIAMQRHFALDEDRLIVVNTWAFGAAAAVLLGSLPYFFVLFRLQQKRHRIALDMIKLVQNVIGHYNTHRTVPEIISRSSSTMPDYVRDEWQRLELASHMGASLEEALYEFARRTDNHWAEDLADILLIKHKYGNDIIDALHKLVLDMQSARKGEERRLAMVTVYRIGTVVMIGFAFFIVFFNVYADGANYRHYFIHPNGQVLILFSAVVLFVSMILVVVSGKRKF